MDLIEFATKTREFLSALFGSKLVVQLRAEIEEAKRERDYFRGRCERLELKQEAAAEKAATPVVVAPRIHREHAPSGRKLWPAIVKERREKLVAIAKQAEAEKANKKPEPAPTPQVQ